MAWIDDRIRLITTVPDDFIRSIDLFRYELFDELTKLILLLDINKGNIMLNTRNLIAIENIINQMEDFMFDSESNYIKALIKYTSQLNVTSQYANSAMGIKSDELYDSVLSSLKLKTIKLFDKEVVSTILSNNIRTKLDSYVTSSSTTVETILGLKKLVVGTPDSLNPLTRYAKTWALTGFAVAERQYMFTLSQKLGYKRMRYSPGTVDDSRDFCIDKQGKVFTIEEIKSWGKQDWQGKIKDTDEVTIFSFLGGWNCMHLLEPFD